MTAFFGIFVVCVFILRIALRMTAKEKNEAKREVRPGPVEPAPQPQEETHDHIRSTELSPIRKLEQLETLRGAGLLTEEEYREKKRDIMNEL